MSGTRAIIVGVYKSSQYSVKEIPDIHVVPRYLIYVPNPSSIKQLGQALQIEWNKKSMARIVKDDHFTLEFTVNYQKRQQGGHHGLEAK